MPKKSSPPPPEPDLVLWADSEGNVFVPTLEGMKPNGQKLSAFEIQHEIIAGTTTNGLTQYTIRDKKATDVGG